MATAYNGKELLLLEIDSKLSNPRPIVVQEADFIIISSAKSQSVYTIVLDDEKIILRKVTK